MRKKIVFFIIIIQFFYDLRFSLFDFYLVLLVRIVQIPRKLAKSDFEGTSTASPLPEAFKDLRLRLGSSLIIWA